MAETFSNARGRVIVERLVEVVHANRAYLSEIDGKIAAWSVAPDAATGDALSTAFMVMTVEQVQAYCARHTGVAGLLILPTDPDVQRDERIVAVGPWREDELVY